MNQVAPSAHAASTNKNAKTPGSKGLAAALFAAPGKGTTKSKSVLVRGSSAATKSGKLPLPLFSEILKKGIVAAATLKGKQALPRPALIKKAPGAGEAGQTAPQQSVALHVTLNTQKESVAKDEKSDVKKKSTPAATVALDLAMIATGATKSDGTKQPVVPAGSSKGDALPQGVVAVAAKPVTAQAAQPTLRIVDLRKKPDTVTTSKGGPSTQANGPTNTIDQSVSFSQRLSAARDSSMPVVDQPSASAASPSQTPLERLRAMAGSELTQATTMILKDGGGEIRLILKPESLGSVRIRMNVVDNKVEGKIIVDSAAVKHVFDGSVDALRRALTAEGFQTGSLSVSVGGQGTDSGERQQRQTPSEVQRMAAQRFERNVPGMESMSLGDLLVNVFV